MSALRLLATALLAAGGFCAGDARRQRMTARRMALEEAIALLTRLRQEIGYRRADLGRLYPVLAAEQDPRTPLGRAMGAADAFGQVEPPAPLRPEEADCLRACLADLGRAGAGQECARLDYYLERMAAFLAQAREDERLSAGLDRRLGFAAGAVLGMLLV